MSPQSNDTSGLSLPPPSLEAQHPAMAMQQAMPSPSQPVATQQFQTPQPVMSQQLPMQQVMSPLQPQVPPVQNNVAQPLSTPSIAPPEEPEDDDALDIEWIAKAKAIVDQLRLDPFAESNAFNEIKADYLQRRHGKTMKVDT